MLLKNKLIRKQEIILKILFYFNKIYICTTPPVILGYGHVLTFNISRKEASKTPRVFVLLNLQEHARRNLRPLNMYPPITRRRFQKTIEFCRVRTPAAFNSHSISHLRMEIQQKLDAKHLVQQKIIKQNSTGTFCPPCICITESL